ncbi:MAG: thiamine diphosphokinase [Lachnospirales bacterium]
MKTIVIGNGVIEDYDIVREYFDNAYVIACDGGLNHCRKMMIVPDIVVGDFDSVKERDKIFFEELGVERIVYPRKKDLTDMEIGINLALEKGSDEIYILGGLGCRFDHSLANLHILVNPITRGVKACLVDEHNIITLVKDSIDIKGSVGQTVSLIPLTTEVTGVTTKNLEYSLFNKTMRMGSSLGVSNVMTDDTASVSVKEGYLIVIMSKD